MSKPTFIMMVGLPASGKSFYAESLKEEFNANIHSSDVIREEIADDVSRQDRNKEVFTLLHQRIKDDLSSGKSAIYDATNIDYKRRRAFLEELKQIDCYKLCCFMATPYKGCVNLNEQRERKIPTEVITRMYKNIYIPQLYEGWDDIAIMWNYKPTDFDLNKLFNGENGLNKISQDNIHHTLTVGAHCIKCATNLEREYKDCSTELFIAALLHDIGKPFTKQFNNYKGESTSIAHYFQHHLVSAYDSLFYTRGQGDVLLTANYIQWHMQPYFMENEKTHKKYNELWGEEFYNNLMLLHKADELAH